MLGFSLLYSFCSILSFVPYYKIFKYFIALFLIILLNDFTQAQDYHNYRKIFESIDDLPVFFISGGEGVYGEIKEVGYLYWNSFFRWLGFSFSDFYILTLSLLVFIKISVFEKYTRLSVIPILYYFSYDFFIDSNQLRHGFAGAIILVSFLLLNKRKYLSSIFLILVASTIHQVSLSLLLVYPLIYFRISPKVGGGILLSALVVAVLGGAGKGVIYVLSSLGLGYEYLLFKMETYTRLNPSLLPLFGFQSLKVFVITFFMFVVYYRNQESYKARVLFSFIVFYFFLFFFFRDFPILATRMSSIFGVVSPFVFILFIEGVKCENKYIFYSLLLVSMLFNFINMLFEFYAR